jgi:hypothetical protein
MSKQAAKVIGLGSLLGAEVGQEETLQIRALMINLSKMQSETSLAGSATNTLKSLFTDYNVAPILDAGGAYQVFTDAEMTPIFRSYPPKFAGQWHHKEMASSEDFIVVWPNDLPGANSWVSNFNRPEYWLKFQPFVPARAGAAYFFHLKKKAPEQNHGFANDWNNYPGNQNDLIQKYATVRTQEKEKAKQLEEAKAQMVADALELHPHIVARNLDYLRLYKAQEHLFACTYVRWNTLWTDDNFKNVIFQCKGEHTHHFEPVHELFQDRLPSVSIQAYDPCGDNSRFRYALGDQWDTMSVHTVRELLLFCHVKAGSMVLPLHITDDFVSSVNKSYVMVVNDCREAVTGGLNKAGERTKVFLLQFSLRTAQ